jgi:hypothetical protein
MKRTPDEFWDLLCEYALDTKFKSMIEGNESLRRACRATFIMNLVLTSDTTETNMVLTANILSDMSLLANEAIEEGLITREEAVLANPSIVRWPSSMVLCAVKSAVTMGATLAGDGATHITYSGMFGMGPEFINNKINDIAEGDDAPIGMADLW